MHAAELEERMVRLAEDENSAQARMTFLIEEFDRIDGCRHSGYASTAKWLEAVLDLRPSTARDRVRVARALRALPRIAQALRDGTLSYRRVRTITRIATRNTEEELVSLARMVGGVKLDLIVESRRLASVRENPALQAAERMCTTRSTPDGMVELTAKLPPVEGALMQKALRAAGKRLDASMESRDDVTGASAPDRRRADALVALARAYMGGATVQAARDEFRVLVHIDGSSGEARLHDGPVLTRATVAEILSSSPRFAWLIKTSEGYAMTSPARRLTPAMRRAILERDARCRYPGCSNEVFMHVHHRIPRARGGGHAPGNLVGLCSFHHRVMHRPGYAFLPRPGGRLAVRTPNGVLEPDPARPHPARRRKAVS